MNRNRSMMTPLQENPWLTAVGLVAAVAGGYLLYKAAKTPVPSQSGGGGFSIPGMPGGGGGGFPF